MGTIKALKMRNSQVAVITAFLAIAQLPSGIAQAQAISPARVKARLIYTRLTGVVPPYDSSKLTQMEALIATGDTFGATKIATEEDAFYNITIRNFASPMSNRALQVEAPLNDFVATVIGNVRDKLSARELLTGNYLYIGDSTKIPGTIRSNVVPDMLKSNNHYQDLDNANLNLRAVLKKTPQVILSRSGFAVTHPEPSGLLTSRSWGLAHLRAGTNRRAVQFTISQFLCVSIDQMADATVAVSHDMIGKDVTRNPQGSPAVFQTKCKSCHNMLDYLRPAYGNFDFIDLDDTFVRNRLVLDPNFNTGGNLADTQIRLDSVTRLPQKYYSNRTVEPLGVDLQDTRWENNATSAFNESQFGWRGPASGDGLQPFAGMISNAQAFSRCMTKRVFKSVCNRDPADAEKNLVQALADNFEANNYRLKGLFEQVAARPECLGE